VFYRRKKGGYAIGRETFVVFWKEVNTPLGLPGQEQAICIRTSFVPLDGKPPKAAEVRYYATSLPPHEASAEALAQMIRGHWGVENKLHHVKDRTFLEDRHWLKNSAAAQVFTFLRTLVVDALRQVRIPGGTGREHCPERVEYMQGDICRPLQLVCNKN
jgi:hypothetical protein